jgi:hypothetical protein
MILLLRLAALWTCLGFAGAGGHAFFGTDDKETVTDRFAFEASLKEFAVRNRLGPQTGSLVFVHFTSAMDPARSMKWCPDCRNADGALMDATKDLKVLGVSLSFQEWERDPGREHPYRSLFGLTGIPSLVAFSAADVKTWDGRRPLRPQMLLGDKECKDGTEVARQLALALAADSTESFQRVESAAVPGILLYSEGRSGTGSLAFTLMRTAGYGGCNGGKEGFDGKHGDFDEANMLKCLAESSSAKGMLTHVKHNYLTTRVSKIRTEENLFEVSLSPLSPFRSHSHSFLARLSLFPPLSLSPPPPPAHLRAPPRWQPAPVGRQSFTILAKMVSLAQCPQLC